jgi:hypothetical protein
MNDDKILVAVVSGFVGLFIGGLGRLIEQRYAAFKDSQGVAHALEAEIVGVLGLVKRRRYREHIERLLASLESEAGAVTADELPGIRVTQDFFTVFHALAPKLGSLGPVSGLVVRQYMFAKGIVEDFTLFSEFQTRVIRGELGLDRKRMAAAVRESQALLNIIIAEGDALAGRLKAFASRRFCGVLP